MKEEVCKKTLRELGVFYLIIIALTNFLGFLLVNSGIMPTQMSIEHAAWLKFLSSKNIIVNVLSVFGFILPALFCLLYVVKVSDGALEKKIINLPLVYSIFGSFGWIISFIFETSYLIYFKIIYKYDIYKIMINSFFNIIQASLFIFTFSFFCIDAIHRKFVLPKLFPEGNITKRSGRIKLSSKFLFIIFYLSVGIFPVFYFFSTLYNFSINSNVTIASGIYYITLVIIIFGIINVINISNYFSIPIKKIKNATNEIVKSDYSKHVEVVSCDDLGELADNFNDMADALAEKTRKILAIQDSVIKGMAVMVESRDNSTGGHINRTSDCVRVFINSLKKTEDFKNLSPSFCAAVIKAAPMHDLGKIAVDDAILRKPGKFTDEEYEKMKNHSAEGARIVENVLSQVDDEEFKTIAINVAHYHHEKWNGMGYPEKISGENIPLEARIMALADVFDALVSKRCYKDSMDYDKAFSIIKESLGSHFDPILGEYFIACRPLLEKLYNSY